MSFGLNRYGVAGILDVDAWRGRRQGPNAQGLPKPAGVLVVCGKQSDEYALGCGAANLGCKPAFSPRLRPRRLAHDAKEPPERRLRAGLPAPQNRQNFGRTALAAMRNLRARRQPGRGGTSASALTEIGNRSLSNSNFVFEYSRPYKGVRLPFTRGTECHEPACLIQHVSRIPGLCLVSSDA